MAFMDLDFGGKGEVKACNARRVVGSPQAFGPVVGLLNPPLNLHQTYNQQRRSQEDCKSQVGSRLGS